MNYCSKCGKPIGLARNHVCEAMTTPRTSLQRAAEIIEKERRGSMTTESIVARLKYEGLLRTAPGEGEIERCNPQDCGSTGNMNDCPWAKPGSGEYCEHYVRHYKDVIKKSSPPPSPAPEESSRTDTALHANSPDNETGGIGVGSLSLPSVSPATPPPSPAPRPQILQMLDPEPATPPADMVERARAFALDIPQKGDPSLQNSPDAWAGKCRKLATMYLDLLSEATPNWDEGEPKECDSNAWDRLPPVVRAQSRVSGESDVALDPSPGRVHVVYSDETATYQILTWEGRFIGDSEYKTYADFTAHAINDLLSEAGPIDPVVRELSEERQRQIEDEGYSTEHDDAHVLGELAKAASAYALRAADVFDLRKVFVRRDGNVDVFDHLPRHWPWNAAAWKAGDPRGNLVKAGALIIAEIQRLDRKSPPPIPESQP